MIRRTCTILLLCVFPMSYSCHRQNPEEEISLYRVHSRDFENRITVTGYLEAVNAQNVICPQVFQDLTILKLVTEGTMVKTGDTVCILDPAQLENSYNIALKNWEQTKLEYQKKAQELNLQVLLLQSQVLSLEATTQISKLDSVQQAFVSESERKIIDLEIMKAEIEKEKLQNKLRFLKEINEAEMAKLSLRIDQADNNVNRLRDLLDQMVLLAPCDGIVQYSMNRMTGRDVVEGDITWGGERILYIPDLSALQARLVVDEASFKRIRKGQKLKMHVDASAGTILSGTIDRKLAAGKRIRRGSQLSMYEIIASLDSTETDLLPGLSISCSVLVEDYADTLVIPLAALFEQDSSRYVYVKEKRKYVRQNVKMVAQSSTEAVISEGLKEDDIISLAKPVKFR